MLKVEFILDGVSGNDPANHKQFVIDLNFDSDDPDAKISSTNSWRWVNERAAQLNAKKDAGLTGGTGVTEGVPLDIILTYGTESYTIKQFLDLRTATFSDNDVECNAVLRAKNDFLDQVSDKATMQYIHEQTPYLPKSAFINMPYVINSIPDYKEAFVAGLSVFVISQQLQKTVSDISAAIGETANPLQAATIIRVALLVVYATVLLIALIKLIKDLIDLLIQPVKYHACCLVKTQLEAACNFLGLKFKSTIFEDPYWSRLCIMPAKLQNPESAENEKLLGFLTPDDTVQVGYYDGTPGDLFRAMKVFFKAKIITDGEYVIFERRDYTTSSPAYIIPDVYQPFYKLNTDELKSNILVEFQTDAALDKNTIQPFEGNLCQIITSAKTVINKDCNLIQGYEPSSIPFARAARKEELNQIEEIVSGLLTVISVILGTLIKIVNTAISIINTITDFIDKIGKVLNLIGVNVSINIPTINPIPAPKLEKILNDRIGMLMLETDFFQVPKIFIFQEGSTDRLNKIDPLNSTMVNATYLWNNFHYVDSFVPTASKPNANQWIRKKIERVPFTWEDFLKVKNNNRIFDAQGNVAKIESLRWNVYEQLADIEYRVNILYTKNLQLTLHEPKGY